MGRPPLAPGTYGEISAYYLNPKTAKARARFRDYNGKVRTVARFGQTEAAAKRALKRALTDYQHAGASGTITAGMTVSTLADLWLARGTKDNGDPWATNSADTYRYIIANEIKPALGDIRLSELGLTLVNRALRKVKESKGTGAAKTMKSALSGMCKYAISEEAIEANPVRDAMSMGRGKAERKTVRALTVAETDVLCDLLRADQRALDLDLPDLVEFMLGTAMRIGEACAIGHANCPGRAPHASLDLNAGTVEVDATLIRITGLGLQVQHRTKTDAGWRVLALPPFAVAMLQRRADEVRLRAPDGVVFGAPKAKHLRDPSNTAGDLREVLDRLGCPDCDGRGWHAHLKTAKQQAKATKPYTDDNGQRWMEPCDGTPPFAWLTSHTFRKTALTRLDEAGLSAREIADVGGHAKASMTQDFYMGRNVVSVAAAKILDR